MSEEKIKSQVESEIQNIVRAVNGLEKRLEYLSSATTPIRQEDGLVEKVKEEEKESALCPIAEQLRVIGKRIVNIEDTIIAIIKEFRI